MRTVLIGLGMVSETYLRAFADTRSGVTLFGVHARSAARSEAFAARAAGPLPVAPRVYHAIEDIAADPDVDAVVLATPPDARAAICATLAQARKPILMEKPIERTAAAAAGIVACCADAGAPLGVMLQHRARPASRAAKRRLEAGEFGEVALVSIDVPWWRDQSYYDQPGRGSYARDGGGVMISQAIHAIDLALWLAGPVRAVQGTIATTRLHRLEAEDFAVAGLEFANGAPGSLTASTAQHPGAPETVAIQTDRAGLTLRAGVLHVHWRDGHCETVGDEGATGSGADPMAFSHAHHQAMLEDFAAALAEGRPPLAPGASVLHAHRLIDAVAASSRQGRRLRLDAQAHADG